jgi:nitrogen fixation NifU-like protein
VTLRVGDGKIEQVGFEGQSCAICKASASMMSTSVKGKSVPEVEQLITEFREMATGKLDVARQPNHLGRLSVFAGVKDLPSRVKCAILPWHTLHAAFHNAHTASTEGDQDPFAATEHK